MQLIQDKFKPCGPDAIDSGHGDGMEWMQLTQDKVQRRTFVNTAMNLRVRQ